jgi:hypothetical protein
MNTNQSIRISGLIIGVLVMNQCHRNDYPGNYKGKPFADSVFTCASQVIPGKIQCEYFDMGGEGIAFHDDDSANSGSGKLNPLNGTYLHSFRKDESVDISYTKSGGVDDNPFNFTEPRMNQLYVGWTAPGEWLNYTVNVEKKGTYVIGLMFTANADGAISLTINDNPVKDTILIPSTYRDMDTVPWRQWHHWNFIGNLSEIDLQKGRQVLTLHTVAKGNMNYDYLEFRLKNK